MQLIFLIVTTVILTISRCTVHAASPRGVFAHFMVGNTATFTAQDWANNIDKAAAAHIDGFALNIAADWKYNGDALALAFPAAAARGFKLIFSFDYAGGGAWPKSVVTKLVKQYGNHPAYWQHDGKPLVSTFEGPENAEDWHDIKAETGCFFMPDWSSMGAGPAVALAGGVADGLFSWAAWPWASRPMDTFTDRSYQQALNGKPYMMAVSPWFFTNLPGYNKNWMWLGGNLWYERWQQTLDIKPDYVQIISWNDFGESHHIGPLDDKQYTAFKVGEAPYNYVKDYPHEGWLKHLPFMIDTYMGRDPSFNEESALVVHQVTWAETCNGGGTTANTASQLQMEYPPQAVSYDMLYIAALLTEPTDLYIESGGTPIFVSSDKWEISPDGGIGLYYTSVYMKSPGKQSVLFQRPRATGGGNAALTTIVTEVDQDCPGNVANWNAKMVYRAWNAPRIGGSYKHKVPLKDRKCISGWGWDNFNPLCSYTCKYSYCPDSCVCTNMGKEKEQPKPKYEVGYPANGDANYEGLCKFAWNLGGSSIDSRACSATKQPAYVPSVSPFLPQACVKGTGPGDNQGLCDYACNFGFCPINVCKCISSGALNKPPAVTDPVDWKVFKDLKDGGLCQFACSRGYCPDHCLAVMPVEGEEEDDDDGDSDRLDFRWVESYLAMGDSFAAGIGVGEVRPESDAYGCSRYSGAYPLKVQEAIQSPNFVFTACSGDKSTDIIKNQFSKAWYIGPGLTQVRTFDLVTMSAGGNDVGFSDVLKGCLFLPTSDAACKTALASAENNIDQYLTQQIYQLLGLVESHVNLDGLIVWTLYAQFFDEAPQPCESEQWCFTDVLIPTGCAKVTVDLRREMNRLVTKANAAIVKAINAYNNNGARKVKRAHIANWGADVRFMDGQMCEPDSDPLYNDVSNTKLAFIRPNTRGVYTGGGFRRRYDLPIDPNYNATEVELWKRDIVGIPDAIAQNFHPNALGTAIQASAVLNAAALGRERWAEEDYNVNVNSCPINQ